MWLDAAKLAPGKEAQAKESTDKQKELDSILKDAQTNFTSSLDTLGTHLNRIEEIRFDPENPTGAISAKVKKATLDAFEQVQEGVNKLGEAHNLLESYAIAQANPYTDPYTTILKTMKGLERFFRKLDQPIDQQTASHGVPDQIKIEEKVQEFIQQYHPEPRPRPWPTWLKSLWSKEKPMNQFSNISSIIERVRSNAQKIFNTPRPTIGAHLKLQPTEVKRVRKEMNKRRKQAADKALKDPIGIPENVKRMYETFYPEGIKWHIDPEVPRAAAPHKEPKEEYARPYQKPGYVPKIPIPR